MTPDYVLKITLGDWIFRFYNPFKEGNWFCGQQIRYNHVITDIGCVCISYFKRTS